MPEGDTIHRTANRLRPALEGQPIVAFDAPRLTGDRPRVGDVIESVEAVGKNLLIRFPKQLVLHTHMKMTGAWHLYRTHEKWQEAPHLARVTIEVPGDTASCPQDVAVSLENQRLSSFAQDQSAGSPNWVAVCFSAPTVRTWRDIEGVPNPLAHLGPDLCLPDVDIELIVARVASIAEPGTSIAEVLLDQRIAAGIGNVYKSEALWRCKVSPFTPVEQVPPAVLSDLFETAGRQLRSNIMTPARTTVPNGLAVYGRRRQPCLRCRTNITS